MKYYSELTYQLYDTAEALEAEELKVKQAEEAKRKAREEAERKEKEIKENRAAAKKEVEEAYNNYMTKLKDYCEKYGAFRMTLTGNDSTNFFRF